MIRFHNRVARLVLLRIQSLSDLSSLATLISEFEEHITEAKKLFIQPLRVKLLKLSFIFHLSRIVFHSRHQQPPELSQISLLKLISKGRRLNEYLKAQEQELDQWSHCKFLKAQTSLYLIELQLASLRESDSEDRPFSIIAQNTLQALSHLCRLFPHQTKLIWKSIDSKNALDLMIYLVGLEDCEPTRRSHLVAEVLIEFLQRPQSENTVALVFKNAFLFRFGELPAFRKGLYKFGVLCSNRSLHFSNLSIDGQSCLSHHLLIDMVALTSSLSIKSVDLHQISLESSEASTELFRTLLSPTLSALSLTNFDHLDLPDKVVGSLPKQDLIELSLDNVGMVSEEQLTDLIIAFSPTLKVLRLKRLSLVTTTTLEIIGDLCATTLASLKLLQMPQLSESLCLRPLLRMSYLRCFSLSGCNGKVDDRKLGELIAQLNSNPIVSNLMWYVRPSRLKVPFAGASQVMSSLNSHNWNLFGKIILRTSMTKLGNENSFFLEADRRGIKLMKIFLSSFRPNNGSMEFLEAETHQIPLHFGVLLSFISFSFSLSQSSLSHPLSQSLTIS